MASVLLVVGHSETRPGAANMGGPDPEDDLYEFHFNEPIAERTLALLQAKGAEVSQDRYLPSGGNVARWNGASDLLVEFHCNAFNTEATGTEVLYAEGSERGAACARIMQTHLTEALKLANRKIKPISSERLPNGKWKERGAYLLWGVSQVALI
ncbi:MAG: N-acetylmuramoyl-L-alanine amidase, partial [Alphaproteobacteria bacterium]